jgi:DNA-directed RNA polymerase subunit H (RpoH/RPB5)
MGDVRIQRDDALRVLNRIQGRILREVREAQQAGAVPSGAGAFQLWVLDREEELAVLEAYAAELAKRDRSTVVAVAEGTAS